ncbi:DNA-binding PadR family transcriptional regulator [Lipingzhangella halophila]|uniref:DNA-binding PadR family transcriptional regulator n=1 Tax=Lipingzhangella halophila TaxID=1783352 RepID=A0A7W7W259_9ACTN|nr:helix-turn-helix transcriptional regulator [Lipingzhangella halophila]MBB4931677.1 DNA-binding PadR family transcriptional regulator [Lipingzhangella halophila]
MDESLSATPLRSPLALVVLALLYEAPTHPYRMHQMIKERGKDKVVNVAQRSSVQQVVHRLARDGLVEELTPEDPGGTAGSYPARVAYRITESGTRTLFGWLHDTLAHPVQEFPRFTAALAFLSLTSPATAADLLQARRATLVPTIEARAADLAASPLPRVLLIEESYTVAMARAELAWIDATIEQLRDGTLTWDTQHLIATADHLRDLALGNDPDQ